MMHHVMKVIRPQSTTQILEVQYRNHTRLLAFSVLRYTSLAPFVMGGKLSIFTASSQLYHMTVLSTLSVQFTLRLLREMKGEDSDNFSNMRVKRPVLTSL